VTRVQVSKAAYRDLTRLAAFLAPKNPGAAARATDAMIKAIQSLDTHADRGRLLDSGFRELVVPFGRYGYVLRYDVTPDEIFVIRITHARERR
jgi:plasmid stabilization system protein ParE